MSSRQKSRKSRKSTKKSTRRPRKSQPKKGSDEINEPPADFDNGQNMSESSKKRTATNPVDSVVAKYSEFGWTLMKLPHGSLNDIVAQKDKKIHFIQVVTPETIDNVKFQGIARNTFIQNAFSNSAIPVYAHVVTKDSRAGQKITVTFQDINLNTRIIVGGNRKKVNNVTIVNNVNNVEDANIKEFEKTEKNNE